MNSKYIPYNFIILFVFWGILFCQTFFFLCFPFLILGNVIVIFHYIFHSTLEIKTYIFCIPWSFFSYVFNTICLFLRNTLLLLKNTTQTCASVEYFLRIFCLYDHYLIFPLILNLNTIFWSPRNIAWFLLKKRKTH